MRDIDVRRAVRSLLAFEHESDVDTRIVEEMGVWHGSARIDLAVINGEIGGYEIKSARDTLDRLPAQAILYSHVFDRMFLVAAERHIERAIAAIPPWWGVLAALETTDGVTLMSIRSAERNPSQSLLQVARLLWREEALAILEAHSASYGVKSASRERVAARLVEALAPSELTASVRRKLKDRVAWLGQPVSH